MDFSWAANPLKLQRAVAEATTKGKGDDVEAIKEIYVRLAGLVIEGEAETSEEVVVSNVKGSKKTKIKKRK